MVVVVRRGTCQGEKGPYVCQGESIRARLEGARSLLLAFASIRFPAFRDGMPEEIDLDVWFSTLRDSFGEMAFSLKRRRA